MIHKAIFSPKSIVVVGASGDPAKVGGKILQNIIASPFSGKLYGINPKASSVQGVACPSLEELEEAELAIFAVPAQHIPQYMRVLAEQKGTRGFIVLSAGFSEMGEAGKALQDEITSIAASCGGSLIGPNCTGVLTRSYAGVFAGPVPPLSSSGCDMVSGSGATAAFIIEQGITAGLRFSEIISVGNSAQIGVEDVLAHWDETYQPGTSAPVKMLYMESITDARRLLKHSISLAEKGCRICAVKAGSSQAGSRAASSHTGAMAADDLFVDALFRKAGIIRCRGRQELVNAASVCCYPRMEGRSMAVVTHAGGPGVMLTDMLSDAGITVPGLEGPEMEELLSRLHHGSSVVNPIDFLATGTASQLDDILRTLKDERKDLSAVTVIFGSPGLTDISDVLQVLESHITSSDIPIFPVLPSVITAEREIRQFKQTGLPFFSDETQFAQALGSTLIPMNPSAEETVPIDGAEILRSRLIPGADGYLPVDQVSMMLDAAGIQRLQEKIIGCPKDIESVPFAFPWAMKVLGPVHKSDVGGVLLNISSEAQAASAAEQLLTIEDAHGVLVQEMASGTEFYCGLMRDELFGHLLMTGLGGIFVETLKDVSSELLPIDRHQASQMLAGLKSFTILQGTRGKPPLDVRGLEDMLVKLSSLAASFPEIAEMDINPVLVSEDRAAAADCRIRISE